MIKYYHVVPASESFCDGKKVFAHTPFQAKLCHVRGGFVVEDTGSAHLLRVEREVDGMVYIYLGCAGSAIAQVDGLPIGVIAVNEADHSADVCGVDLDCCA